ncbi:MAG: hypothetical protein GY732_20365, partial [Gammaproteobacteria bacterium]|nr:hypothetical protein [Gammaproteobacteria bacterium]
MNKQLIRKNKLSLSLALALGVGMTAVSGSAMAVALDGVDRLGDAGIYQYYTAQGGWQTFIRLINTSDDVASVKIRFREAANSREVLDFIVFMSPHDMWTAWTDDDATPSEAVTPGLRTGDTSCLYPVEGNTEKQGWVKVFPGDPTKANVLGADFSAAAFTGIYADGNSDVDARLGEGHIEIIGIAQHDPASDFGVAVTHNNGQQGGTGMPANCGTARALWESGDDGGEGAIDTGAVGVGMSNILAMNGYLINVAEGQGGGFDPDILTDFVGGEMSNGFGYEDWHMHEEGEEESLQRMTRLTATNPDLDSGTNYGFGPNGSLKQKGRTMQETHMWDGGAEAVTGGVDGVSYEFQRASVINEWAASANPGNIIRNYYTQ